VTNPLVSIIIPCGSRHVEHVRLAAASVAWQSLAHRCETIIACDGGADVPILPNCTILQSDGIRRGPAHTRNRALRAAQGEFILPLDADDYLLPRTVEHLLREYSTGRHGYIYGDAYTQERDGRYLLRSAPDYSQRDMAKYNIHVVTTLCPRKHWLTVGGWDEGVDAWEDWTGNLRLAIAGICGYRLPYPIFTYRVYEGDRMTRFYGGAPEHMEKVWQRYRNHLGEIPMALCCGGDGPLAALAGQAVMGMTTGPAAEMGNNMVRVQFLGDERGTLTWECPLTRRAIRLGNNTMNRYADLTAEEAAWLAERAPIRVVPQFDDPDPPRPLEPIVTADDVLTSETNVLRPRRGRPSQALRPAS
jgi:Glycosyl transferase family 2